MITPALALTEERKTAIIQAGREIVKIFEKHNLSDGEALLTITGMEQSYLEMVANEGIEIPEAVFESTIFMEEFPKRVIIGEKIKRAAEKVIDLLVADELTKSEIFLSLKILIESFSDMVSREKEN